MKKLLLLFLILALSLSLVACGECEEHTDSDKDGVCDECGEKVSLPPEEPEEPEEPIEPEVPEEPEDKSPSEIETPKVEF